VSSTDLELETLLLYAILFGAGVVSGFVNTIAGGGSLLTLPALMLLGLPANVANGTNRLSVITQSLSGTLMFYRAGKLHTPALGSIALPTFVGAIAGAGVAAIAPADILKPVLLGTMIAMAVLMTLKPVFAVEEGVEPRSAWQPASLAGLFAAGLYGGFVQAGVGFVLLAVLGGVMRYDTVRANALKLACTLIFGVGALAVFAAAAQIVWIPAAVLAVGTVVGSQLGVKFALKANAKVVRGIILVTVIASCIAAALKE
jgi:uncharacterized membrane protein YfcA